MSHELCREKERERECVRERVRERERMCERERVRSVTHVVSTRVTNYAVLYE